MQLKEGGARCGAHSKRRKPIRSEFNIARSSSSRTAIVRKTSDAGKGECRKRPIWAVRWRRDMYDGSNNKW